MLALGLSGPSSGVATRARLPRWPMTAEARAGKLHARSRRRCRPSIDFLYDERSGQRVYFRGHAAEPPARTVLCHAARGQPPSCARSHDPPRYEPELARALDVGSSRANDLFAPRLAQLLPHSSRALTSGRPNARRRLERPTRTAPASAARAFYDLRLARSGADGDGPTRGFPTLTGGRMNRDSLERYASSRSIFPLILTEPDSDRRSGRSLTGHPGRGTWRPASARRYPVARTAYVWST